MDSPLYQQIFASSVGGFVSALTLNPITVLKTHLQSSLGGETPSIQHIVKEVVRTKGIRGFWDGAGINVFQSIPTFTLFMLFYENLKVNHSQLGSALSGGIARFLTVSLIAPIELIRTIKSRGSNLTPFSIAQDVIKKNGFLGLYMGWKANALRDTPQSMIYWLIFENLRPKLSSFVNHNYNQNMINNYPSPLQNPNLITFLSCATSGAFASVAVHPFDVIKTQHELAAAVSQRTLKDCPDCYLETNKKMSPSVTSSISVKTTFPSISSSFLFLLTKGGGVPALYRGLALRLSIIVPSTAIMITVYEAVRKYLRGLSFPVDLHQPSSSEIRN